MYVRILHVEISRTKNLIISNWLENTSNAVAAIK